MVKYKDLRILQVKTTLGLISRQIRPVFTLRDAVASKPYALHTLTSSIILQSSGNEGGKLVHQLT